ncbi:helix-turn-helix domain-containing protein [Streptosporangium carneum]|uniref:Transcriptional regulator n=1 Tax=Streptosporangium carneum TaxID=47481 RepID=A0A9W6HY28_9ACTN|nr:helix-turn-helix transcriptional regulator [Streptosporangium carneum]GLK08416.1 transcriptional regulator [Streptosporangium carneum]
MTASPEPDPYASPRIRFGAELRKIRLLAGLSQRELGGLIHLSGSQVSMVESGRRSPTLELARTVDAVLGRGRELTDLLDRLTREADQMPRWFRPWLDFESEAESLHVWQLAMVPGLFQVEGYARALIANEPGTTPEQAEERLAARLERQRLLDRARPPMMWVVLDESVLHRPVGGPEVMKEQMRQLLELAERPHISLQMLPYAAYGTVGLLGSFVVAEMPHEAPPVAYIDSQSTEDRVSDRTKEVKSLICRHGVIRADALSRRESLGLIKETMRRWTT